MYLYIRILYISLHLFLRFVIHASMPVVTLFVVRDEFAGDGVANQHAVYQVACVLTFAVCVAK